MTTVIVKSDGRGLTVNDGESKSRTSTYYRCSTTSSNSVGIWMEGKSLTLTDVWTSGGYGAHVEKCSTLRWRGGGSKGPHRKYGIYLGNCLNGLAADCLLERLTLLHSETESTFRMMGAYGVVNQCLFDGTKAPHEKQAMAIRYGKKDRKLLVTNSTISGSIVIGPLGANAGSSVREKYRAYTRANPLNVEFRNCTIIGYVQVGGQSTARFYDCDFAGVDPRGIGPTAAVTARWIDGKFPVTQLFNCKKGSGWKSLAGAGVKVE
jgi:hypothetical protein